MNRRLFLGLCPLVLSFCLPWHGASAQSSRTPVADEVLVRWNSLAVPRVLAPGQDPSRWQQQSLLSRVSAGIPGARVARTFAGTGWTLLRVPQGFGAEAARARLATTLGGANVALNSRRHSAKVPNDPAYASQWQWPKIAAPVAWDKTTGSSAVVVALLDSGIDLNHADLKANLWKNPKEIPGDGIDNDKNGYIDDVYGLNTINPAATPQDDNGHGTFCAGLIGAVGNNGASVTGACWNVKIMALKFLNSTGDGDDADAIEGLEYAVKMKKSGVNLRVISNSWSGPEDNPALKAAFQLAENAGILSVCAAGNGGHNTDTVAEYPASYAFNSVVAVAASTQDDNPAYFSNYGAKSVDLAAPGVSVVSLQRGGGQATESGTSMSTPIVAGAAALLLSSEGTLSASALKDRLIKTVDPIPGWKGLSVSGGRLNLARALSGASLKISGLIYRKNGSARVGLAGALVSLNGKTLTSTDQNGNYVLSDLTPGRYSLSAALSGYKFAAVSVALPRAAKLPGAPNALIDIAAKSVPRQLYSLSGRAVGTNGLAKAGVSIFLADVPNAVALTDGSGNYSLRDRAPGTYKLSASNGTDLWRADPTSMTLPATNTAGAPNGTINFFAVVTDKIAPKIVIITPKNGSVLLPGPTSATGTASDPSGVKQIYFQLTRQVDFSFSFYDWTSKTWTTNSGAPGIKGVQNASGTSLNWSQALPNLSAASYSLRVWGTDSVGNESNGEADAVVNWSVNNSQSNSQSAAKSAPDATPGVKPSAGAS